LAVQSPIAHKRVKFLTKPAAALGRIVFAPRPTFRDAATVEKLGFRRFRQKREFGEPNPRFTLKLGCTWNDIDHFV
jgi:hypothetical protein